MAIPNATLQVLDGNLGAVPSDISRQQAAIGVSSAGVANTVYTFSNINTLRSTLGDGPLVEYAAHVLAVAGGPVLCVKVNNAGTGSAGSVTQTGTGTSVVSVTGSPRDSYQVVVKIVKGAIVSTGNATFQISLDNGFSYGPEISLAAGGTYTVPDTGFALAFTTASSATVVAGDLYKFTTVAPAFTVSEFNTAFDALTADGSEFFMLQVVGVPADTTAMSALAAAVDSKMNTLETNKDFSFAMMSAADDTRSAVKAALLSFVSNRVLVSFGFAKVVSAISLAAIRRPVAWLAGARASQVQPSEDLAAVKRGALRSVVSIENNEEAAGGDMDLAGFTTTRTIKGRTGFYLTNARLKSDPSSDFRYVQHRRVMDLASRTVVAAQLKYLNDKILVDKTTGRIEKTEANKIDADLTASLAAVVVNPGEAVEAIATIDRTENILSTETLTIDYAITPFGYAKRIVGRIGFTNPAISKV